MGYTYDARTSGRRQGRERRSAVALRTRRRPPLSRRDADYDSVALPRGAVIGIVGGGPVARMMTLEARGLGYHVAVVTTDPTGPAASVADIHIEGRLDEAKAIHELTRLSDVITVDSEHVPADVLRRLHKDLPIRPGPSVLGTLQDRLQQRSFLARCAVQQPRHLPVGSLRQLEAGLEVLGRPALLKARREGFGLPTQILIDEQTSAQDAFEQLGGVPCVLEAVVPFEREVCLLLARSVLGEVRSYPLTETRHRDGVLLSTLAPAPASAALTARINDLGARISGALGHVGILAIQCFIRGERVMVNRLVPRPHESGNFTFGACETSQFEQHIRAIAGLPLGEPHITKPAATVNLFGDLWEAGTPDWREATGERNAHVVLYGRREPLPDRKMGHLLVVADDPHQASHQADRLRARMSSRPPGRLDAASKTLPP